MRGNATDWWITLRVLATLWYYGFAQFLPLSYRPCGGVFKWLRAVAARRMIVSCGVGVNIEPRVDFGSGRNLSMGDYSGIGARSRIEAADIGAGVIMAPEVMILARNHQFLETGIWIGMQGKADLRPVCIGEGSWIGARAILLPGVKIGKFAVIGAGAVVSRDVPDYGVAVGNPARVIRKWNQTPASPQR